MLNYIFNQNAGTTRAFSKLTKAALATKLLGLNEEEPVKMMDYDRMTELKIPKSRLISVRNDRRYSMRHKGEGRGLGGNPPEMAKS